MSDLEDIINEIQLDPKYQLDGEEEDFDFEEDFMGLMADLEGNPNDRSRERNFSVSKHQQPQAQHPTHASKHNPAPVGKSIPPHTQLKSSPAGRSSTQANLDELESLVAELTSSGDVLPEPEPQHHHQGHHQGHQGHQGQHRHNAHASVDQPNFDSSLDALLVDLGGIGEKEAIPPNKQRMPQHVENDYENDDFEGLLSDLTGGSNPAPAQPAGRSKGNSIARPAGHSEPKPAAPSGNKKPINPRDSAAYVDDLETLMVELVGAPPQKSNQGTNRQPSVSNAQQNRGPPVQRGVSRGALSTHQEAEDLDSLMNELSNNKDSMPATHHTPSKSFSNQPAGKASANPAQRQPTGGHGGAQKGKPHSILENDDIDALMADLVPTAQNKGRQSSMPQHQTQPRMSEVSELDNLMADLVPPSKKPTATGRPNHRPSITADLGSDLDDVINNLQTDYGMVEAQPTRNPVHKTSIYASNTSGYNNNNPGFNNNSHAAYNPNSNPNNNPHAVYNPNSNPNNPHAVYNPHSQSGYNQNTYNPPAGNYNANANFNPNPAGRTNTNQAKPAPPRAGPSTRDLTALMDDLNSTSPVDNYSNQQQVARKPQEKLAKGVCAGCRKYISSTQKIQAMGREYHPEHFQCSTCNKVIGNGNFFEKEGQPQCEACYQSVFCSKCALCNQPITSHCVTALSQSWHPQCFVCAKCHAPFNNTSYYEKMGKPYCSACISDLSAQRCRSCNQAIRGSVINALGTAWHPEHFVCQSCHQPFPGGAFYEVNGLPYCEVHYQSIR